ncbi:DUF397 domain-containing protein [Streptomyces sp. MZ04]|nr:DUF397 domain-containing protein [Streptomyces sp. MZ04]TGB00997.1 DUF397 domain-containing protein [Streptomyces sp. MZ04]
MPDIAWFKSSYSGANTTECVEIAVARDDVLIRDSKRKDSALVAVRADAWAGFIASLRQVSSG